MVEEDTTGCQCAEGRNFGTRRRGRNSDRLDISSNREISAQTQAVRDPCISFLLFCVAAARTCKAQIRLESEKKDVATLNPRAKEKKERDAVSNKTLATFLRLRAK